jgi:hypothetical protein
VGFSSFPGEKRKSWGNRLKSKRILTRNHRLSFAHRITDDTWPKGVSMKHLLLSAVLFLATTALAQQEGQHPPTTTPPTFPEGRETPRQPLPPDTQAPPAETMPSQKVEAQISDQLTAEPSLSNNNIDVRVDDNSVVLSGSVETVGQHDLAVRIARSNAGARRVVDRIKVRQQT